MDFDWVLMTRGVLPSAKPDSSVLQTLTYPDLNSALPSMPPYL
jgi:hypothetical protein